MICTLCNEPFDGDPDRRPLGASWAHRVCLLRVVMGGIGHFLDHDYWCVEQNDCDAGLTFHDSAIAVDKLLTGGEI